MLYMKFIIVIAWAWWVGIFTTNTNCKAVSFRDEWSVAEVGCGTELVATVAEAVMLLQQLQQQQQHSFSRDNTNSFAPWLKAPRPVLRSRGLHGAGVELARKVVGVGRSS